MVLMLPIATDNGARLAAILPTGLAAVARCLGTDPAEVLTRACGISPNAVATSVVPDVSSIPPLRSFVMVVVDGLGHANLQARAAHARTISRMPTRRIETVIPSTTGAALTTLTTGRLPGEHGLIGYRIRHPEHGLVSTLKDWNGISDRRVWQRSTPLFELAAAIGARPVAIGRPAHATGGLTEAILTGAEYHGAVTIADRCAIASRLLRDGDPVVAYLYIDELDKAAHSAGWQSDLWLKRLEQLDAALEDLLRTLPGDVGVVVTADHGMIDVPEQRRIVLGLDTPAFSGVAEVGGEPRMRSLYLHEHVDPVEVAERVGAALGKLAWVGTRSEAIEGGWFGPTAPVVAERLGDVIVTGRGQLCFSLPGDSPEARAMVGQHGGLSSEERGVPLALGGALEGSGFAALLARVAAANASAGKSAASAN
ncbi:alkaline phosphatase family protein [Leucobacter sp. W1478]|uniref:alkaline phosphatase family protein n=1 Tax=Leucobacter sp. W1478 TaxID=3439065 RepID=UPI003F2C920A